jgi:hypothetical protein
MKQLLIHNSIDIIFPIISERDISVKISHNSFIFHEWLRKFAIFVSFLPAVWSDETDWPSSSVVW